MHGVRNALSIAAIVLAVFTASAVGAVTVDLTSGTTGTDSQPSFDGRTRGVDVTVLGASDKYLSSMTASLLNIAGPATVSARVYQGGTLIASGSVAVPGGIPTTAVVPMSATLTAGATYRLCFFVDEPCCITGHHAFDPNPAGSGGFPYVEATGTLRVVQAYESPGLNVVPSTPVNNMPYISAQILPFRVVKTIKFLFSGTATGQDAFVYHVVPRNQPCSNFLIKSPTLSFDNLPDQDLPTTPTEIRNYVSNQLAMILPTTSYLVSNFDLPSGSRGIQIQTSQQVDLCVGLPSTKIVGEGSSAAVTRSGITVKGAADAKSKLPNLTSWGMMILTVVLLVSSVFMISRRRPGEAAVA